MGQCGNPSFKDCQRFGPKKVSGKTIPIRDCTGEEWILIVFRFGGYVLEMDTISLEFNTLAYGDSNKTIYNLINHGPLYVGLMIASQDPEACHWHVTCYGTPSHPPRCPSLDHFQACFLLLDIWVPCSCTILSSWSHNCFVSLFFHCLVFHFDVTFEES